MHMCYICGKEFGSTSLAIHEVQCLKKFQDQQALLPVEHRKPGVCVYVCLHVCVCVLMCVCVCVVKCVCVCVHVRGYVCV